MLRKRAARRTHSIRPSLERLEDRAMLAAGDLDLSFSGDGRVTTDIGMFVESIEAARSVAIQPDGKIVAAGSTGEGGSGFGDFVLARYHPDGSLDSSFGGATGLPGTVRTDLRGADPISSDRALDLALQPDGKILAIGESWRVGNNQFRIGLVRYNSDGSLDATFGTGGIVIQTFAGFTNTRCLAGELLASGKIIVTGFVVGPGNSLDIAVARFNSDGSLDTTFGTGGTTLTSTAANDTGREIKELADGSLIVAGTTGSDFALARFTAAGALDTAFGAGGIVATDFGATDTPMRMAVQPDGRLVVGGDSAENFAVARYNPDGSLDTSFDGDGKTTVDIGGIDSGNGVALHPDGRIAVSGLTRTPAAGFDFAVIRLNPNGSLDTTFDGDGRVITNFGTPRDAGTGIALLADGRAVVVGVVNLTATGILDNARDDFALVRYNLNGSLDTSFDGDGKVVTSFVTFSPSPDTAPSRLAVQPDGKVVIGGYAYQGAGYDFAVVRYNADGSLDTTFDGDGKLTIDFGTDSDFGYSVAVDGLGRIVIGGYLFQPSTGYDFAVARLNPDGGLDTTFSGDGKATVSFGTADEIGYSVAVDASNRIIVGGYSFESATGYDFAVARLTTSGDLDASFSGDGKTTIDFGTASDIGSSVAVDLLGRIVVGGYVYQPATGYDFAVARLNVDGNLDLTFSGDGKATVDFASPYDIAQSIAVDPSGRVILVGYSYFPDTGGYDFAIARLNISGGLDTSFSSDGKTTIDFGGAFDVGQGVAVDSSGRILVSGYTNQGNTGYDFGVARLNTSGSLDVTFTGDGRTTIDFAGSSDIGTSIAVDAVGRIVVGGYSFQGTTYDFAVARLEGGAAALTPEQVIGVMNARLDQLVADGRLTAGQANSLKTKVKDVVDKIDAANWNAVAGMLGAFINHVQAWDGTVLTHDEAQLLIELAQSILDQQP